MDKLVERVLAVSAGLAPVDGPGLVRDNCAIERDVFAIAFHHQLLQVCGETFEILLVRQHRDRLRIEEVAVPYRQYSQEHGKILFEWRAAEVLIHFVKAREQRTEMLVSDGNHGRQPDRRIHRVTPPDPVPEPEHVRSVDAERGHALGIGRDGNEVPAHGLLFP